MAIRRFRGRLRVRAWKRRMSFSSTGLDVNERFMIVYWRHEKGSYAHPFALNPRHFRDAVLQFITSGIHGLSIDALHTEAQLSNALAESSQDQTFSPAWVRYAPLWLQACAAFYYEYVTASASGSLHPWADPQRYTVTASEIIRRTFTVLPHELKQLGHRHYVDKSKATRAILRHLRNGELSMFLDPSQLIKNFAKHPTRGPHNLAFDLTIAHITEWILNLACLPDFSKLTARIQYTLRSEPGVYQQCLPPWARAHLAFYNKHMRVLPANHDMDTLLGILVDEVMHPATAGKRSEAIAALHVMVRECPGERFFQ